MMILKRFFSSSTNDPVSKLFFNPKMQESLKSLTGVNPEKVLRPHRFGSRVRKNPNYVFLTTKQLQEAQKEARELTTKMIQMPPVMSERSNDTGKVLSSRNFYFNILQWARKFKPAEKSFRPTAPSGSKLFFIQRQVDTFDSTWF